MDATELEMMQDSYGKAKFLLNQGKSPFSLGLALGDAIVCGGGDGADLGKFHGCRWFRGTP